MNIQQLMGRLSEQSPEQLLAGASQRLPFWISLVLVVLIAWYLAKLVWALYPPAELSWSPPPAPADAAAAGSGGERDYRALLAASLFGEATEEAAPPPETEVVDAPDTRLNLKLRATVAAGEPRYAHAIIADGSNNEQVYFLRDSVPGGATLHRVQTDRVILNRGGVLEALRLPRETEAGDASRRTTGRPPPRATQPTVQQLVGQNPASLMEIVRPQPFMPNGQLRGYRLYPGRDRQQFAALGLRPGDLVTEINGMTLNNPAQGMEIFRSLGNATQVTLTLERNGEPEVLTVDTAQLAAANGIQ